LRVRGYIVLGVVLLLMVGRLIWFPAALFIVTGSSMLPAYRTGDLVLGVATYVAGYSVGDVVVWYATYTHGVIHRVINVSENYVVTKGDNNPLPDPPVPKAWVKYRALLQIPREIWVPVVLGLAGLYLYRRRREVIEYLRREDYWDLRAATAVVAAFIILDLAVVFIVPVYWFSYRSVLLYPNVELRRFTVVNFSAAVAEFSVSYAEVVGVESCSILVGNSLHPCEYVWASGSRVVIGIPSEVYYESYNYSNSTIATIGVALNVTFDKGWLFGVYNYTFNWRPLAVEVANRGLVVYNPNPVPFNLTNVRVVYLDFDSFGRPIVVGEEALGNMTVEPLSSVVIEPEAKGSYCYIQFTYSYKFAEKGYIYESRRIDFKQ